MKKEKYDKKNNLTIEEFMEKALAEYDKIPVIRLSKYPSTTYPGNAYLETEEDRRPVQIGDF